MVAFRPGFFGKLPGHGDFIERHLPGPMLEALDVWLQQSLAISREQLGDRWLDVYLTSPLWRFAATAGCLDSQQWLGLMTPSVDSVGRYFPLVVAAPLPEDTGAFATLLAAGDWFAALEGVALDALEQTLSADALDQKLAQLPAPPIRQHPAAAAGAVIQLAGAVPGPDTAALLDWQSRSGTSASSLWWTSGSARVEPCLTIARSMPDGAGFSAMLDGQWQQWRWGQANFIQ